MMTNKEKLEILKKINSTPSLSSCLYDLGLLPEQLAIDDDTRWNQMTIIAVHWPINNER